MNKRFLQVISAALCVLLLAGCGQRRRIPPEQRTTDSSGDLRLRTASTNRFTGPPYSAACPTKRPQTGGHVGRGRLGDPSDPEVTQRDR